MVSYFSLFMKTAVAAMASAAATNRVLFASASSDSSAPPFATFGFTKATLLSGGLTDCLPSPNVSSCVGGLATALAVFRDQSRNATHTEFIFNFDKDTAFVQMHPFDYTVNIVAMREFGIKYYYAEPSIIPNRNGRRALDLFFNDDVHMLQANLNIPPSDDWDGFVERQAILFNGTVGIVLVDSSAQSISLPAARVILAATKYLRSRVKVVVVVNNDASTTGMALLSELSSNPPDVFLDLLAGGTVACSAVAGMKTQYCGVGAGYSSVNLLHIYLNSTADGLGYAAVQSEGITDLPVDAPVFDATYYAHQAFLAGEASKAIAYDPTVGTTNVGMPSGGWWDNTYPCFEKECGHCAVYGRALMHYVAEADLAITNSGGFRGKGWPAGDIKMSSIWEMCPYANTIVSMRMIGFKVWELMELSARNFLGANTFDGLADRNLQGDGFRIEIDMSKPRFTNRLLAVWIRNRQSGAYEPLVRTQYYTVATDNYMYEWMPDISTILQKRYRGESVVFPYGSSLLQTTMADMFTALSPYDTLLAGVLALTTDSKGRAPMEWVQRAESCSNTQYWDEGIVSCIDCGDGYVRAPNGMSCVAEAAKEDRTTLIAIVVPIACVFAVVCIAIFLYMEHRRRKNTRNTSCAPKSGDGITIIFTDIQSSTKLWGTVPASMAAALEIHHRVIRRSISQYGGYEVKTIGDSFMIACSSADDAVLMAVSIQEGLAAEAWPIAIGEVYACEGQSDEYDRLDVVSDCPREVIGGADVGVKVRIGINTGVAEAVFDEVSKGYDYYGPAVNTAARIEAAAQGGQILTAKATSNLLSPHASYVVAYFTSAELHGIAGRTELLQIAPRSLEHRKYDPTRMRMGRAGWEDGMFGAPPPHIVVGGSDAIEVRGDASGGYNIASKPTSQQGDVSNGGGGGGADTFDGAACDDVMVRYNNNGEIESVGNSAGADTLQHHDNGGGTIANTNKLSSLAGSSAHPPQYYAVQCQESLASLMMLVDGPSVNTILQLLCSAWRVPFSKSAAGTRNTIGGGGGGGQGSAVPSAQRDAIQQLGARAGPVMRRRAEGKRLLLQGVGRHAAVVRKDYAAMSMAGDPNPSNSGDIPSSAAPQ